MSIEDAAQAHEAQVWAIHNRAREVITYQPGEHGCGPAECLECDADMHPVRRGHGFTVCTECQTKFEKAQLRCRG